MSADETSKDEITPPEVKVAPEAAPVSIQAEPISTEQESPMPMTPRPETAAPSDPRPAPVSPKSGGFARFLGLVTGGALAAGGGFGLAAYGVQQGWPLLTPPSETAQLEALQAEVARIAKAQPAPVDLGPLESRVAALEQAPAMEAPDLGTVEARLKALEARPAQIGSGDPAAISAQIAAEVSARMQTAKAETETMRAEAEAVQAKAAEQAALLALQGAMASGIGLPEAIAAAPALPEALAAWAKAPTTLPTLRDGFAEPARQALAASRSAEQAQGTTTDRLATFLLNQTGARSTVAREGDDADAVLSRMQAAVDAGDLTAALALRPALPEPAQAPLAEWAAQAEALLAAQTALSALISAP